MKYTLLGFLLFLFIIILSLNYKNTIQINGTLDKIDVYNPELEIYRENYKSNINDTFSLEGALISTIIQNLTSFYPNVYNYTEEKQISESPESTMPTNNKSNNVTDFGSQFNGFQQQQQTLYPIPKPISQYTTNIEPNASEDLSDNLVSMLSGIILESIHTGNPTINNETIQQDSDDINSKEDTILVSGKWKMDVENSNITSFDTRFVMITSNGTGFHWHSMDNLKTSEKFFLGKDDSATINGKLDFFTGNNTTKQPIDILLAINNLELIQITPLDKDISSHFYGFPIYGTI
ncbi:MAG: hypothetical protein M3M88_05285, partial [Thermoproteota archaeon]|nr:hypothetical protein [Thermoproteota archaeon]